MFWLVCQYIFDCLCAIAFVGNDNIRKFVMNPLAPVAPKPSDPQSLFFSAFFQYSTFSAPGHCKLAATDRASLCLPAPHIKNPFCGLVIEPVIMYNNHRFWGSVPDFCASTQSLFRERFFLFFFMVIISVISWTGNPGSFRNFRPVKNN